MIPNPATLWDLERRGYVLPAAGTPEEPVPQTRLDEAWRALQRSVPSIETSLLSGWVSNDDVIDVIVAAALRVLRNPEGIEQESAAIDDYSETRKRADATEDLYFTAAEKARLTPPVPTAGSMKYC